ncbi:TetR/AcrR family transcriptional regulator [Sphingomonas fennica]|uniref:TetR/AcrR family transcriptional regulator n=2 Tax=Edaphosphingomonas fennica TaxID=114404 RepID=A0A2T4HYV2_9SPHN|nr:TetR/AcrR family transcriptional regulator [Sphingomonas fennica]
MNGHGHADRTTPAVWEGPVAGSWRDGVDVPIFPNEYPNVIREMPTPRRSIGRPRLLTRDMVIDAAIDIGLAAISMKRLAEHLGVGTATLYQYVGSRDELLKLAAARQVSSLDMDEASDLHWSKYIAAFAHAIQDQLVRYPQIIVQFIDAGLGPEVELEVAERFLQGMVTRGFTSEKALEIQSHIGALAIAGAVAICRERASRARGRSSTARVQAALTHYAPEELPLIRAQAQHYSTDTETIIDRLIVPLIEKIARERGEALPEG